VQGEGRSEDRTTRLALLALRPVALVQVGQLATAGAPELREVRRSALLVPQPQEHRLQRMRDANFDTLTALEKMTKNHAKTRENDRITCVFAVPRAK
jgi:hypothetical protein